MNPARQPTRLLTDLLRRAAPGQVLQLPPGHYSGALGVIDVPGLTLTSPGPGVVLHADGQHVEGKGTLVVRAPGTRLHNLEFRGARVPTGNGAGIRFESGSLALQACRFLDNEMGLLSAGRPDMQLAVHDCVFGDAPRHAGPMLRHLLYVGRIAWCVVTGSRFHHGWRGHLVKSRARVNRILWNTLVDGDEGAAAYELEFPEGGDNLVLGNRLAQSAHTLNPAILSMGAEARPGQGGRLVLRDNQFDSAYPGSAEAPGRFVHLWPDRLTGGLEVQAEGNRFTGPGRVGLP